MAEAHLYGNLAAPDFPFERVAPHVTWLSAEVAGYAKHSYDNFDIIINIILVFAGARTSALLPGLNTFRPFINKLNYALANANASSFHLEVQEFYMGDWIYRQNNPRFIHHRLTTRKIGQNLDMFAAGNLPERKDDKRFGVDIWEMETWSQVTAEVVLERCLESDSEHRLVAFTDVKVNMFNRVFRDLGLGYRFEWFTSPVPNFQLESVMYSEVVPSRE